MPVEDFLFSAGGGFLFGARAGYAIKKVLKIAAVVVGLFVTGLEFLAYKGWIDVKWIAMENGAKLALANMITQTLHTLNVTASQFATHCSFRITFSSGYRICTWTNDWIQEGVIG